MTGTHGGVEHVICYFPADALERMAIGDRIQVRAQGQGMQIEGFERTVACMNLDPNLFEKMNISAEDGKLIVPVAARVPAYLMGSGIGSASSTSGDYDIMTADHDEIVRLGLHKHGPGVTTLLTSKTPVIEGRLDAGANLADYMGV